MNTIRLVIADDHPLFRQGVVDAFTLEGDLAVLGQATNGQDALSLIRSLRPDIAVIDLNMPSPNGQQVLQQVRLERLPTRIILLTAYQDKSQILLALKNGAAAYCSKDIVPEKLVETIRLVAKGKFIVGERVLDRDRMETWLDQQEVPAPGLSAAPAGPGDALSTREMEILRCITQGMSNKEIAVSLGISQQTVKNHITTILRKVGVEDRTQAALLALRRGWARLDQTSQSAEE